MSADFPPRRPIVGVMGSGKRCEGWRAAALGRWLAEAGVHLLTGGGGGTMAEVSRAFAEVRERRGSIIGVLPCGESSTLPKAGYPNPWVEIPIHTHLPLSGECGTHPLSRNHINVLTSAVVIVLAGGAGTASEAALALEYARPVVAFVESRHEIPALPASVPAVPDLASVAEFVRESLGRAQAAETTRPG